MPRAPPPSRLPRGPWILSFLSNPINLQLRGLIHLFRRHSCRRFHAWSPHNDSTEYLISFQRFLPIALVRPALDLCELISEAATKQLSNRFASPFRAAIWEDVRAARGSMPLSKLAKRADPAPRRLGTLHRLLWQCVLHCSANQILVHAPRQCWQSQQEPY